MQAVVNHKPAPFCCLRAIRIQTHGDFVPNIKLQIANEWIDVTPISIDGCLLYKPSPEEANAIQRVGVFSDALMPYRSVRLYFEYMHKSPGRRKTAEYLLDSDRGVMNAQSELVRLSLDKMINSTSGNLDDLFKSLVANIVDLRNITEAMLCEEVQLLEADIDSQLAFEVEDPRKEEVVCVCKNKKACPLA